MADAGDTAAEAAANRDLWSQANREYGDEHAALAWAADDITWGVFNVPEQQLGVLGDVRGLDVTELGCGTAYFSAWLARRGARPTGVDLTPAQLATARRCQERSGIFFPLIEADAGDVPLPSGSFDLAISECGASLWCDPARWVPEAAGLLRPGGRLVFHTTSVLAAVCSPEPLGPARRELSRGYQDCRAGSCGCGIAREVRVTKGTKAGRSPAPTAYISHVLDGCGVPPRSLLHPRGGPGQHDRPRARRRRVRHEARERHVLPRRPRRCCTTPPPQDC